MAVPKKRTSKSKRDMRRSHHALTAVNLSTCSNCGAKKLAHNMCPVCFFYNGRLVVKKREKVAESVAV